MAYRILAQLALTYGVAIGRAVFSAWMKTANQVKSEGIAATVAAASGGVPLQEARRILNVPENASVEEVNKAFETLYAQNGPEKGNSFYLQSKVYRARESLIAHLQPKEKPNDDDDLDHPDQGAVKNKQ